MSHVTSPDCNFFICNMTGLLDDVSGLHSKFNCAMCLIVKHVLVFHLTCKIKDDSFREGNWLRSQSVTLINSILHASHRTWHQWGLAWQAKLQIRYILGCSTLSLEFPRDSHADEKTHNINNSPNFLEFPIAKMKMMK